MKSATNGVRGALVELGAASPICSIEALVHDRDAVGHRQRLVLVVRDVDERRPERAWIALSSSCISCGA